VQDPFLLQHARTDSLKFLDLLRERFAVQVGTRMHQQAPKAQAELEAMTLHVCALC
jgi:hypothetical protein